MYSSTALAQADTSCTNDISKNFATSTAPEPVKAILIVEFFKYLIELFIISKTVLLISEKCLLYSLCMMFFFSSSIAILTVVEPMSSPTK